MSTSFERPSLTAREQALALYSSLQQLVTDLPSEKQRVILTEALRTVISCVEELEETEALARRVRELEARLEAPPDDHGQTLRTEISMARFVAGAFGEPLLAARSELHQAIREMDDSHPSLRSGRLVSASRRLDQLHSRALALNRFALLGELPLRREEVDMGALAAGVARELTGEDAREHGDIRIGPLAHATGDRALLRIVLRELISNGLKFRSPGKRAVVTIGSRNEKGHPVWYVRDRGIGFRREQQRWLFHPFQTLHRFRGYEGAGMGLALVRQIIVRHGGQVWAEGEENGGATFFFSLGDSGTTS